MEENRDELVPMWCGNCFSMFLIPEEFTEHTAIDCMNCTHYRKSEGLPAQLLQEVHVVTSGIKAGIHFEVDTEEPIDD
jgi:hypothetical protein